MKERCESCNQVNGNGAVYSVKVTKLSNGEDQSFLLRDIEVCHQCMQSMTGLYIKLEEDNKSK